MKANNHPLVRDLRRLLAKHNLAGVVLLGIDYNAETIAASAGYDVKTCDALGPVLRDPNVDLLFIEMLMSLPPKTAKEPAPLPLFEGDAA